MTNKWALALGALTTSFGDARRCVLFYTTCRRSLIFFVQKLDHIALHLTLCRHVTCTFDAITCVVLIETTEQWSAIYTPNNYKTSPTLIMKMHQQVNGMSECCVRSMLIKICNTMRNFHKFIFTFDHTVIFEFPRNICCGFRLIEIY